MGYFRDRVVILLLAISSLIPLWRELCMVSVLCNLLRFILWLKICVILVNILDVIEKNIYFIVLGYTIYIKKVKLVDKLQFSKFLLTFGNVFHQLQKEMCLYLQY